MALFGRAGRWLAFAGAIVAAVAAAALVLIQRGRRDAEAELAVRKADARVRAIQTEKEIRRDVESLDRSELGARADRWMRD
ncbi:MAG: hypothetical protein ACEPO2_14590 [Pelagibaca sp.]